MYVMHVYDQSIYIPRCFLRVHLDHPPSKSIPHPKKHYYSNLLYNVISTSSCLYPVYLIPKTDQACLRPVTYLFQQMLCKFLGPALTHTREHLKNSAFHQAFCNQNTVANPRGWLMSSLVSRSTASRSPARDRSSAQGPNPPATSALHHLRPARGCDQSKRAGASCYDRLGRIQALEEFSFSAQRPHPKRQSCLVLCKNPLSRRGVIRFIHK